MPMSLFDRITQKFAYVEGCCLHDPQWRPADVAAIVAWANDQNSPRPDEDEYMISILVVRLKDGGYGLLLETYDDTGHGCRCGSMTVREPTRDALLAHLTDEEKAILVTP